MTPQSFAIYAAAAVAQIVGCSAFWFALKLGQSKWWLAAGVAALCLFAWLVTLFPAATAGRACLAYGGVYAAASLFWFWFIEKTPPDRWATIGAVICLFGIATILVGQRTS